MQNIFKHELQKNVEDVINIVTLQKKHCNSIVENDNCCSHGSYRNKCEDGKHIHNPISSQAYCDDYGCSYHCHNRIVAISNIFYMCWLEVLRITVGVG
jgi:hypothetical protein